MAQLLLMGVSMFCGLPAAPVIAPLLATVFPSPLNLLAYAGWLLGLKYGKTTRLNRFKGNGSWKALAKGAAVLYALTMIPLYFLIILAVCKASAVL